MDVTCYDLIKELPVAEVRESYLETIKVQRVSIDGDERQAIFAHPPASLAFTLAVPPHAWLEVGCGLDPSCWQHLGGRGVWFELWVEAEGGRELLWQSCVGPAASAGAAEAAAGGSEAGERPAANRRGIPPGAGERQALAPRWVQARVDLGRFGGRTVCLVLTTHTRGRENSYCWSFWGAPCVGYSLPIDGELYASWQGRARRLPSLDDPGYFSLSRLSQDLLALANRLQLTAGDAILDLGCGEKPYYPIFAGWTRRYIGVDIELHPNIDCLVSSRGPLPFADGSFALVLSTQVLEHVEEPKGLVEEMHRVLKPGGTLYLSAPFVWEVHNYPRDFWRFTDQGLRLLLQPFREVTITPQGTSSQALLQAFSLFVHRSFPEAAWTRQLFALLNEHLLPRGSGLADSLLPAQFIAIARR
ncbi:MAG: methyltransferase domain-containing protein [Candidatus Tectomicrobia bacterium]|nr:methyltransferase domain-containing protein [Candidatus Tectomicrobia bacterium]